VKSQPVDFLLSANVDVNQAKDAYSAWRSDGADHFMTLLDEVVSWIAANPDLFPKRYRDFRRAPLRNSYYAAFYVIEPTVTVVVAVLDLRQRPARMRRLLRNRR
jgi:hypothetical protein